MSVAFEDKNAGLYLLGSDAAILGFVTPTPKKGPQARQFSYLVANNHALRVLVDHYGNSVMPYPFAYRYPVALSFIASPTPDGWQTFSTQSRVGATVNILLSNIENNIDDTTIGGMVKLSQGLYITKTPEGFTNALRDFWVGENEPIPDFAPKRYPALVAFDCAFGTHPYPTVNWVYLPASTPSY